MTNKPNLTPETLRIRGYILRYQVHDEESAVDIDAHAAAWAADRERLEALEGRLRYLASVQGVICLSTDKETEHIGAAVVRHIAQIALAAQEEKS